MRLGRWFKPDPEREAAVERVRAFVRSALHLADDVTISVNEIECGDPACPGGVETVILVRGKASVMRAFKLPGPIPGIDEAAIGRAVAAQAKSA